MSRTSVWTCPGCLRVVPARIEECYCGVKRSQVPAVQEEPRGSRWLLPIGLLLTSGLALFAATRLWRSPSQEPAPLPRPTATWAPRLAQSAPPSAALSLPTQPSPNPAPSALAVASPNEPVTPESPTASPELEAAPFESLDDRRQRAAEELNRAFEQIAVKAERVRLQMRHFRDGCWTEAGPLPTSGCNGARQELRESF